MLSLQERGVDRKRGVVNVGEVKADRRKKQYATYYTVGLKIETFFLVGLGPKLDPGTDFKGLRHEKAVPNPVSYMIPTI